MGKKQSTPPPHPEPAKPRQPHQGREQDSQTSPRAHVAASGVVDGTTAAPTRQRRPGQRMTAEERQQAQEMFLAVFSVTGNIRAACQRVKVARSVVYQWLEHDETFSLCYHQAEADVADVLEGEALRRAVHGVDEPLVSMGKLVRDDKGQPLTIKRYSDTLLIKLLAARHPKYKEARRVELTGKDGGPVEIAHVRQQLEAKLATMAARLHWPAVPDAPGESGEPGGDEWGEP